MNVKLHYTRNLSVYGTLTSVSTSPAEKVKSLKSQASQPSEWRPIITNMLFSYKPNEWLSKSAFHSNNCFDDLWLSGMECSREAAEEF